jgi:Flp pilus assembly protein TadB
MLSEDEKTPPLIPVDPDLLKSTARTPVSRKNPPVGRPPGALSIAEMVEKITEEVRRGATDEIDRKQRELRVELGAEIRGATSLGIAALVMNAVAILAVLGFAHAPPGRGVGAALIALTVVFVGAVAVGSRRARTIAK